MLFYLKSLNMKKYYVLPWALAFFMVASATSSWASTAKRMKQYDSWGAYSFKDKNETVCYILSKAVRSQPSQVKHGDNYFLLTKRKELNNSSIEPQLIAGYNLKKDSNITVTIGSASFTFFADKNLAWLLNPKEELAFVNAMKKGSNMVVKATSVRGTKTEYSYSLKGVNDALNNIQNCK